MILQFVFIGEGTSDNALISHLENICVELGAEEVTGIALDNERLPGPTRKTVAAKLGAALLLEPSADLFLIHRDADAPDPQSRYDEVAAGVATCQCRKPYVAIVPVQETEAWLLLDEEAIRKVAGKPNGRRPLNLPTPGALEGRANPKEILEQAIAVASENAGDRLQKTKTNFPANRRALLENLSTDGPITQVPAWNRMRSDLKTALSALEHATEKT